LFTLCKRIVILFLIPFILGSCATTQDSSKVEEIKADFLRVGVTPNYPPIIFRRNKQIVGVEADLARRLGKELNRPVQFIELSWDEQIPALLSGRTDIIMSGMSMTQARRVRINFTDYYIKSGLMAMIRLEDASRFTSAESILQTSSNIGVVAGTTSDVFVRMNFPNVLRIVPLTQAGDAPPLLKNRSIDVFVHDAPSIMWLASEYEADLLGIWEAFNEEYLAWGVRRDDRDFLTHVNSILGKWKEDGTLNEILFKWLPSQYLHRFM